MKTHFKVQLVTKTGEIIEATLRNENKNFDIYRKEQLSNNWIILHPGGVIKTTDLADVILLEEVDGTDRFSGIPERTIAPRASRSVTTRTRVKAADSDEKAERKPAATRKPRSTTKRSNDLTSINLTAALAGVAVVDI
jgi:hypothetical protein